MTHPTETSPFGRLVKWVRDLTGGLAKLVSIIAALSLILLSISIIAGIVLRMMNIDNSWTYDLDLFCLIWLAFTGTVATAMGRHHVTAGIAIENLIGRGKLLIILRFLILFSFLCFMSYAGFLQALDSFTMQEITLDVVQWPVWVAKAAVPIGIGVWAVAELHKFLLDISQTD